MKVKFIVLPLVLAASLALIAPAAAQFRGDEGRSYSRSGDRDYHSRDRSARRNERARAQSPGLSFELGRGGPALRLGPERRRGPCSHLQRGSFRWDRCMDRYR